jgi:hypothetical protein
MVLRVLEDSRWVKDQILMAAVFALNSGEEDVKRKGKEVEVGCSQVNKQSEKQPFSWQTNFNEPALAALKASN